MSACVELIQGGECGGVNIFRSMIGSIFFWGAEMLLIGAGSVSGVLDRKKLLPSVKNDSFS